MALREEIDGRLSKIRGWTRTLANAERSKLERTYSTRASEQKSRPLETIVFEDEEELGRFLAHVFERYDGRGFEFTNVPIPASIRVRPWLLEHMQGQFKMHSLTEEDLVAARQALQGRPSFDPKNLENLRIPQALLAKKTT